MVTRRAILQRNSNQKVQCGMVTRAKAPNFNNNEFFIWNFRHEKITVYESRRAIETEGRFEYFSLTAHGISCIFRLSATNTLCTYGFVYSPNTTDDSSAIFCTFSGPGLGKHTENVFSLNYKLNTFARVEESSSACNCEMLNLVEQTSGCICMQL